MKAFVEELCPHCIIVRAGPLAERDGCAWDTEWTGHIEGEWLTVKAFAGHTTPERTYAAIEAANKHTGLPVRWKRLGKNGPYWLHQVSGVDGKGKIIMSLPKAADANLTAGALKATHGGKPSPHGVDVDKAKAGAAAWMKAFEDGTYACLSLAETPEDGNGESLFIVRRKRLK